MSKVLVNFGLLFGGIGFLYFLFIIISGFFGCCVGLTTPLYLKIVMGMMAVSVLIFIGCMINNCCGKQEK